MCSSITNLQSGFGLIVLLHKLSAQLIQLQSQKNIYHFLSAGVREQSFLVHASIVHLHQPQPKQQSYPMAIKPAHHNVPVPNVPKHHLPILPQTSTRPRTVSQGQRSEGTGFSEFWSRTDCVAWLNEVTEEMNEEKQTMEDRYDTFTLTSMPELLSALRLTKPCHIQSFNKLEDVLVCHRFLQRSHSIRESVRADLVVDYLQIVEDIKESIEAHLQKWTEMIQRIERYVNQNELENVHLKFKAIQLSLDPSSEFSKLSKTLVKGPEGILDRQLFSGLLNYIPNLLLAMKEIVDGLKHLIQKLDFQASSGSSYLLQNSPVESYRELESGRLC